MIPTPFNVSEDEMQLGRLAMKYRRLYPDKESRKAVIAEYAEVVDRLIRSGTWNEVPSPEDQLASDDMPKAFFDYWFSDSSMA